MKVSNVLETSKVAGALLVRDTAVCSLRSAPLLLNSVMLQSKECFSVFGQFSFRIFAF